MKKIKKILIFVLCAFAVLFTVGFSNVKAATISNFVVHQDSKNSAVIDTPMDGVSVTYINTYGNNKEQLTGGNSMTLTIKGYPYEVEKVILDVKTNKSSGAGNIVITRGSNKLIEADFITELGSYTTKYTPIQLDATPASNVNDDIVIKISATAKSIYCNKFTIVPHVNKVSVNYVTNCDTLLDATKVVSGEKISQPKLVNPGFEFKGWYTDAEFKNLFDFNTEITQDTTLYAKWVDAGIYSDFVTLNLMTSLNVSYSLQKGTNTFIKVTNKEDWTGTYILVANNSQKGAIFQCTDDKVYGTEVITQETIEFSEILDKKTIEIEKYNQNYAIKFGGKYIYSDKDEIAVKDTPEEFSIEVVEGQLKIKQKSTERYFQYNANRFRLYASDFDPVFLYEKNVDSINVSTCDLRFGTIMTASVYDALVEEGNKYNGVKFFIELQKENKVMQNIECTPVRVNSQGLEDETGEFYQFAVVLTNVPSNDFAIKVIGNSCVEINGVKHYINGKTSSVQLTAQDYINATDTSSYTEHLGVLGLLAK